MRHARQVASSQAIRGFVCHVEEYRLYHKGTRAPHDAEEKVIQWVPRMNNGNFYMEMGDWEKEAYRVDHTILGPPGFTCGVSQHYQADPPNQ